MSSKTPTLSVASSSSGVNPEGLSPGQVLAINQLLEKSPPARLRLANFLRSGCFTPSDSAAVAAYILGEDRVLGTGIFELLGGRISGKEKKLLSAVPFSEEMLEQHSFRRDWSAYLNQDLRVLVAIPGSMTLFGLRKFAQRFLPVQGDLGFYAARALREVSDCTRPGWHLFREYCVDGSGSAMKEKERMDCLDTGEEVCSAPMLVYYLLAFRMKNGRWPFNNRWLRTSSRFMGGRVLCIGTGIEKDGSEPELHFAPIQSVGENTVLSGVISGLPTPVSG